jgi:starch phosphorylase
MITKTAAKERPLAVPEFMGILVDKVHSERNLAWQVALKMLACTNHTLLPEALDEWPKERFEEMLHRQLAINDETHYRFLSDGKVVS